MPIQQITLAFEYEIDVQNTPIENMTPEWIVENITTPINKKWKKEVKKYVAKIINNKKWKKK